MSSLIPIPGGVDLGGVLNDVGIPEIEEGPWVDMEQRMSDGENNGDDGWVNGW